MNYFANSRFMGGNYAHARADRALVKNKIASSKEAARAIKSEIETADAIIVGAGAGLSAAAGLIYSGKRFDDNFADFKRTFGITDMYSGGFYPFPDLETYWAWWSRHILINRYNAEVGKPYLDLYALLKNKNYFVITTNVDHQFQKAGFNKERLFYTQGDYGLFQCSRNCKNKTFDNEKTIRAMVEQQHDLRVPFALLPTCPDCGAPLVPNLRVDGSFCEDTGWQAAAERYQAFLHEHRTDHVVYLELGVGNNTPVIIKYPFWNATDANKNAVYACINKQETYVPAALTERSILVDDDLSIMLDCLNEH